MLLSGPVTTDLRIRIPLTYLIHIGYIHYRVRDVLRGSYGVH
jgi:hypothetical protein